MSTYSAEEIAVVAASRMIRNGETVFVGVGKPVIATLLAKLTHAPDITMVFETGIIRDTACELPRLLDTLGTQDGATMLAGAEDVNALAASGRIDLGILGAGQVDRFGNMNSVAAGDYHRPVLRWPGGGGANDIGTLCRRTVVLLDQNVRRLCERVDFVTVPGYLDGTDGARERAGLLSSGPAAIVTDLAVFGFHEGHAEVHSVHPEVGLERLAAATGWDIGSPQATTTDVPTAAELDVLHRVIDPDHIVLPEPRRVAL